MVINTYLQSDDEVRNVETVILGGGVCGVGAGITLLREGNDDFLILERAEALGGTWLHNSYPGCGVDIPSHLYSFSFAPNPEWRHTFAKRDELMGYVADTAEHFGVPAHVHFGTEILDATWDGESQRWQIETNRGRYTARFFIVAAGPLHEPEIPALPGLESFRGEMFHSSAWPADFNAAGRRIAVIGAGASAIQFVPEIQRSARRVTLFQRTPSWVMPKVDWRTSRLERRAMRTFPGLMRLARWVEWAPLDLLVKTILHPRLARMAHVIARWNINRAIKDPELRRKVTPDYVMGCKRTAISNNFYPALAQANVEVVHGAVTAIREDSVIGSDGNEHAVDTIVFGTGFKVLTDHPVAERIRGSDGISLADTWQGSPKAFNGTVISGFPNMFMMFGPNIGTVSGFVMAEAQLDYIAGALRAVRREGLASIDVRPEAQAAFCAEIDRVMEGSVFTAGGCTSYYLDKTGRVALAWPWTMAKMRRHLRNFDLAPYAVVNNRRITLPVGVRGISS